MHLILPQRQPQSANEPDLPPRPTPLPMMRIVLSPVPLASRSTLRPIRSYGSNPSYTFLLPRIHLLLPRPQAGRLVSLLLRRNVPRVGPPIPTTLWPTIHLPGRENVPLALVIAVSPRRLRGEPHRQPTAPQHQPVLLAPSRPADADLPQPYVVAAPAAVPAAVHGLGMAAQQRGPSDDVEPTAQRGGCRHRRHLDGR